MSAIGGRHFLRALTYAMRACPTGDAQVRLAHLVFHQNRIIASDGRRWHIGILPKEAGLHRPFAVTRESCETLKLSLEYAERMSRTKGTGFHVELHGGVVDGPESTDVEVQVYYGAKNPICHPLANCPVGYIPEQWEEPVAVDAPVQPLASFDCGRAREAMWWYRSWDKDHGTFTSRIADGIARLDIECGNELVAAAFLLPDSMPAAQLVHDEPLFESLHNRKVGQSILDLQIDGDGAPAQPSFDVLSVDGHEFKVKGLPKEVVEEIIGYGPCVHGTHKDTPCWKCTEEKVKEARKNVREARRKLKAKAEPEATSP